MNKFACHLFETSSNLDEIIPWRKSLSLLGAVVGSMGHAHDESKNFSEIMSFPNGTVSCTLVSRKRINGYYGRVLVVRGNEKVLRPF